MPNAGAAERVELHRTIWRIANELRGKMNADEFRDYCLGFIFFKYLPAIDHLISAFHVCRNFK